MVATSGSSNSTSDGLRLIDSLPRMGVNLYFLVLNINFEELQGRHRISFFRKRKQKNVRNIILEHFWETKVFVWHYFKW